MKTHTEIFNWKDYKNDIHIGNEGNPDIQVTKEQTLKVWELLHSEPKLSVVKIMGMTDLSQQTIYNIKHKKYFKDYLN